MTQQCWMCHNCGRPTTPCSMKAPCAKAVNAAIEEGIPAAEVLVSLYRDNECQDFDSKVPALERMRAEEALDVLFGDEVEHREALAAGR